MTPAPVTPVEWLGILLLVGGLTGLLITAVQVWLRRHTP